MSSALSQLIELTRKLEARGVAADAAEEALAAPQALLAAHEQAVMGGLYASRTERWEASRM